MFAQDLEKAETQSTCTYDDGKSISSVPTTNELPTFSDSMTIEYPDGGWEAWLTVVGAFLALVCTFGQLNSFGTFQSWYSEHQLSHLPPSTISWIGAIQLWVFFFSVSIAPLCLYPNAHVLDHREDSSDAFSMPTALVSS